MSAWPPTSGVTEDEFTTVLERTHKAYRDRALPH